MEKPKKAKEPEPTPDPPTEVTLSFDDIARMLEINLGKKAYSNLNGVMIYTPYRIRETPRPGGKHDEQLKELIPFDVVSTVKYNSKDSKDSKGKLLTLKAEEGAPGDMIEAMASRIEYGFRNESVVAVTCVDSSHGMAAALAKLVADKLDVPYQSMVKKTMNPEVSWDEEAWQAFQDRVHTTKRDGKGRPLEVDDMPATPDEYIAATLRVMNRERDQARRTIAKGEKPSLVRMMNMKTGHKSLFNLFDKVTPGDLAIGSKILVVDDNIDSGWTPHHVAKRMREAGLTPLFAAGFKMMRYAEKKVAPVKQAHIATPDLDKAIDDMGRLADEFASDLFQVGSLLMAMSDSTQHGVQAAEVYEVWKVSPTEVQLKDIDTDSVVRLRGSDLAPDMAHTMWANAA